jgi:3-hydroxy-9,10-secoandrosta-1,3,5(10)-triene-9,17-dione monooxygenase
MPRPLRNYYAAGPDPNEVHISIGSLYKGANSPAEKQVPMTATRRRSRKAPAANTRPIPVPDAELTPNAVIERARSMRETLRTHQAETEAAGRVSDATNAECVAAGFYRILQPRRYGGYEFDLPTFAKVMIEVSRGCPSTGWVVAFTAGHTHVLAKYPEEAQTEVYGNEGEFRAPLVGGNTAHAVPVEGGYLVNGYWDYASGCDLATHFFGSCEIRDTPDGEPKGMLMALFPADAYEIERNWDMLGMKGTGSHRVKVRDLFVPGRRIMERATSRLLMPVTDEHARALFDNPMYLGPSLCVLMAEIAAVAVGTGYAVLDAFEDVLSERTSPWGTAAKRSEDREFQVYFGKAMAILETARDALIGCTQDFMDACRRYGEGKAEFTPEMGQRIVLVEQQCCKLAGEAVSLIAGTAGTRAARPGEALERHYRDMTTLLTHHTLFYDRNQEMAARIHFGLDPLPPRPNVGTLKP